DLHLGQEIDHVLRTPVELGMALLATEALGLGHGDALQSDLLKRFLHLVELERLNDRLDLFHSGKASGWEAGREARFRRNEAGSMPDGRLRNGLAARHANSGGADTLCGGRRGWRSILARETSGTRLEAGSRLPNNCAACI